MNNSKDSYDISYSVKVGPSIYHVLARRKKNSNSKHTNPYFVAEDNFIRSKSTNISEKSSANTSYSKYRRQSASPNSRSKTNHNRKMIIDTDLFKKLHQQQKPIEIHHYSRRYIKSKSKKTRPTIDKKIKNKEKISSDFIPPEITEEKYSSIKINENEIKRSIKSTINNQTQELVRLIDEQHHSLIHLLEQHIHTIKLHSTDIIKQILLDTFKSQEHILTKELEHSLIITLQQELEKLLRKQNENKSQSISFDTNTITQLENILTETLDKYVTSTNTNNTNTLNNLFSEQKQILFDTLIQQQTLSSIDLIKQAFTDVLSEYNSPSITTNTINICQLNNEIEIKADLNQTRIDIAFRQQRDTIVANRYLRDNVRQWSNIRSIFSLIKKIQECGTNDLEHAWLLYCWIGKNIHYDENCTNNSSECVFQNRLGQSYGFVNLYNECCSLLNITSLQITGFIKHNDNLKLVNHIWIGIIIDEFIYLIDPTWNNYNGKFEDFYFLISPEEFIYTHYSDNYQLLKPKLTKEDFIHLPIIQSNYYRLNINLLKPKQNLNQITENIFEISLKIPTYVDLILSIQINSIEYPSYLHTLCQRDRLQKDIIHCYLAPPTNGLYDIIIYAKTNNEIKYQEIISMKLNVIHLSQSITFPIRSRFFNEYKCILIEPLRGILNKNEHILIQMIIPDALFIQIKNGDEIFIVEKNEYENDLLKKEIHVHGDIHICARWNEKTEKNSTICIFNMI